MELRRYLFENRIKVCEFAKQVDYAPATISMIINGRQKIGRKLARNIEKITNGMVTAEEVTNESQRKKFEEKNVQQFLLFK